MYKIGIIVFENVEELDFVGPFETLSYANKLKPHSVKVDLISTSMNQIKAFNGLRFMPDKTINNDDCYDVLIIPGGNGRIKAMHNNQITSFVKSQVKKVKYLCSVCTGSFIIGESIDISGLTATSHYTALDEMTQRYPESIIVKKKVVKNQGTPNIWFAAGISSGINLSLELLKELFNEDISEETKKRLEFNITT
jgi:cyclohexyl-isocyanide hydratase